jgi:hypothetical protein
MIENKKRAEKCGSFLLKTRKISKMLFVHLNSDPHGWWMKRAFFDS